MSKTRLASQAITRAGILLSDVAKTRWVEATHLLWISEAQLAITTLDPRATRKNATLTMVAGHRQALPDDALAMLDGTYNGSGGVVTPLRSRQQLDLEDPNWVAATGSADALHIIPPQPGEKDFIVYPNQPVVPGTLDITYSANPIDITDPADVLGVEDEYFIALVNYIVYRAQMQDDDNMQEASTADKYYQAFIVSMPYQAGVA